MTEPSSCNTRNQRNQRNFKPKGQYLIWIEKNEDGTLDVYSTNSIFWRDFFR